MKILLFIFVFLFTGCSFGARNDYGDFIVKMPIVPQKIKFLEKNLSYEVMYISENTIQKRHVELSSEEISIILKKNDFSPILVYLVYDEKFYFYPSGCIYPHFFEKKSLPCTFEDGFIAKIAFDFIKRSTDILSAKEYLKYFNWLYFRTKCKEKVFDIWAIDQTKIIDAIYEKKFSSSKIKEKKLPTKEIDESIYDWWFCQNIFYDSSTNKIPFYNDTEMILTSEGIKILTK